MLVYEEKDLDAIKKGIAEELKNNPQFESAFDSKISYVLSKIEDGYRHTTRRGIDVTVSKDGKSIQIREPMDISHVNETSLPCTEMKGREINLTENGQMEVIEARGRLSDARAFYRSNPSTQMMTQATSVLDTFYTCRKYEPNGVEVARGHYYKTDWGLTGVNYDDEMMFSDQLYTKGWHMPKSWDEVGRPELNEQYVNNHASIMNVNRTEHKGVVEIYKADLRLCGGYSNRVNVVGQLGRINPLHPEVLSVESIFAETYEYGKYKPTPEWSNLEKYAGKTWQEIQADIEAEYPEVVKSIIESPESPYSYKNSPKITVAALKEYFDIKDHDKEESR